MKLKFALLAVAVMVLLTGCIVSSVYPFYQEKDVAYDARLVGEWVPTNGEDKEIWKFTAEGKDRYGLQVIEKERTTDMEACLFKLGGQLYLDLLGKEQKETTVPVHILMKFSLNDPEMQMRPLSHEWVAELIKKTPETIRHHIVRTGTAGDDYRIVFTAETAELQKFVTKYKDTADAWGEQMTLKRRAVPAK